MGTSNDSLKVSKTRSSYISGAMGEVIIHTIGFKYEPQNVSNSIIGSNYTSGVLYIYTKVFLNCRECIRIGNWNFLITNGHCYM